MAKISAFDDPLFWFQLAAGMQEGGQGGNSMRAITQGLNNATVYAKEAEANRFAQNELRRDRRNKRLKEIEAEQLKQNALEFIQNSPELPDSYKDWLKVDPVNSYKLLTKSLLAVDKDGTNTEKDRLGLQILQQRLENMRTPKVKTVKEVDPLITQGRELENAIKQKKLDALINPVSSQTYKPKFDKRDLGDGTFDTTVTTKEGKPRALTAWERRTNRLGADPSDANYFEDLKRQRDELASKNLLTPSIKAEYDNAMMFADSVPSVVVNGKHIPLQPGIEENVPTVDDATASENMAVSGFNDQFATVPTKTGNLPVQTMPLVNEAKPDGKGSKIVPHVSIGTGEVIGTSQVVDKDYAPVEFDDPTVSKKSYKPATSNVGTRGLSGDDKTKLKPLKNNVKSWARLYNSYKTRFNTPTGFLDDVARKTPFVSELYVPVKGFYDDRTNVDPQKSSWWREFQKAVLVDKIPIMGVTLSPHEQDAFKLMNIDRTTPPQQVLAFLAKSLEYSLSDLDDMVASTRGDPRITDEALRPYYDLSEYTIDVEKIKRDARLDSTDAVEVFRQQNIESLKEKGWEHKPFKVLKYSSPKKPKDDKKDKKPEVDDVRDETEKSEYARLKNKYDSLRVQ
jgi:hypothetical protein